MGGGAVADGVWGEVFDSGLCAGSVDDGADNAWVDSSSFVSDEEGFFAGLGECAAWGAEPLVEGVEGGVSEGDDAFFIAFAVDSECGGGWVEGGGVEVGEFGDADGGGVEDFEHGPVADGGGVVVVGLFVEVVEEVSGVVYAFDCGEALVWSCCDEGGGDVVGDVSFFVGPFAEGAQ